MKPEAVQRAEAEAERAFKEAYPNGQEPEVAAAAADPNTPVAEGLTLATEQEASPPPSPQGEEEGWRQRYLTLKGKYDTEVPRLQQDVTGMRMQLGAAVQQISTMQEFRQAPNPIGEVRPAAQTQQGLVSPEEVDEYGAPFVDFMRRLVKDTVQPELSKFGERVQQVAQVNATTANQAMLEELGRRVPDYRKWDLDPGFNAWLNETDYMAGVSRRDMFKNAEARHDGARVAAFFQAYLREIGQAAQSAQQPTVGATQPTTLALETMVGPGRSGSPSPSTQGRPIYTERDISRFYADVSRGVYRNRPEEQARIESEIVQAGAEGRVSVAPRL